MKELLNAIRTPRAVSPIKRVLNPFLILFAGIALGILAKALDETVSNALPAFLQALDLRNFFSRIGIWAFCGVVLSVNSKTPLRAAINALFFFVGMVGSYYLYTVLVAGFFPRTYMMIWFLVAFISPFMGYICWYAKSEHPISVIFAGVMFACIASQAFSFGFWYFDVSYALEAILLAATCFVLYVSPRQMLKVVIVGTILFFIISPLHLFWGVL